MAPLGVQNLLSLRVYVFQSSRLTMAYPSVTAFGFSADAGRTQRFPPTSLPLPEKVVRILRHQQRGGPAWSQKDLSTAVSEGVGDTSEESLLHSLVGSWRPSIRLARLPWLLPLQKMTMLGPWWYGTVGSGLGPVGCPDPFYLFDSAELRLAGCEKYTTGARAATVNSSEESGHHHFVVTQSISSRWRMLQLSLDVTVASFLAPCLANLKIIDVDSFLKEICWRIVAMSSILTRDFLHGQPRLASTSCVKGSKDCLSRCALELVGATGVKPQNTGIHFGSAGKRHARFDFEADKNR